MNNVNSKINHVKIFCVINVENENNQFEKNFFVACNEYKWI